MSARPYGKDKLDARYERLDVNVSWWAVECVNVEQRKAFEQLEI